MTESTNTDPYTERMQTSGGYQCIYWSDGFITGEGGPEPCPSKSDVDRIFAEAGWY